MNTADVFTNDGFSQLSLTTALNKVPNLYGEIGNLGIFNDNPVNTTHVFIEQYEGSAGLIVSTERGTAGAKNNRGKRTARNFEIPRLRLDDQIKPSDIQNVRAFGSDELESASNLVLKTMEEMKRKQDQTLEFMRASALQGLVLRADGTVEYDLFNEFGVTKKIINMDLGNANAPLVANSNEISQHVQENLKGETATSLVAICSPSFFNKYVGHDAIQDAYKFYSQSGSKANNPVLSNVMKGFDHHDITWISYGGKATVLNEDGSTSIRDFIPEDKAYIVPMGTANLFQTNFAPADTMETVNTMGLPYNAWMEDTKTWFDVVTETNPLPICTQPEVLIELQA